MVNQFRQELHEDGAARALSHFSIVPGAVRARTGHGRIRRCGGHRPAPFGSRNGRQRAPARILRESLQWADSLALLQAAGDGRWALDPFLAKLLITGPGDVKP